jgi:hypothetical protein
MSSLYPAKRDFSPIPLFSNFLALITIERGGVAGVSGCGVALAQPSKDGEIG